MGISDLEKKYKAAKKTYQDKGKKLKSTTGRARASATKSYNAAKKKYKAAGRALGTARTNKLKSQKVMPGEAKMYNKYQRSKRAQTADSKKTAKVVTDMRWKKNPGKYDYPGVDTKKKK